MTIDWCEIGRYAALYATAALVLATTSVMVLPV